MQTVTLSGNLSREALAEAKSKLSGIAAENRLLVVRMVRNSLSQLFPDFLAVLSLARVVEFHGLGFLHSLAVHNEAMRVALAESSITSLSVHGLGGLVFPELLRMSEGLRGTPSLTAVSISGANFQGQGPALSGVVETLFKGGPAARITRLSLRNCMISTDEAHVLADAIVASGALASLKALDISQNPLLTIEGNLLRLMETEGFVLMFDCTASFRKEARRSIFLRTAPGEAALVCVDPTLTAEDVERLAQLGGNWTTATLAVLVGGTPLAEALSGLLASLAQPLESLTLELRGDEEEGAVSPNASRALVTALAAVNKVVLRGTWEVFPGLVAELLTMVSTGVCACSSLAINDTLVIEMADAGAISSLGVTVRDGEFPGDLVRVLETGGIETFHLCFRDSSWGAWTVGRRRAREWFERLTRVMSPETRSRTHLHIEVRTPAESKWTAEPVDLRYIWQETWRSFRLTDVSECKSLRTVTIVRGQGSTLAAAKIDAASLPAISEAISIISSGMLEFSSLSLCSALEFIPSADMTLLSEEIARSGTRSLTLDLDPRPLSKLLRRVITPGLCPLRSLDIKRFSGGEEEVEALSKLVRDNESLVEIKVYPPEGRPYSFAPAPPGKNYRLRGCGRNERMRSQIASLLAEAEPTDSLAAVGLLTRRALLRAKWLPVPEN